MKAAMAGTLTASLGAASATGWGRRRALRLALATVAMPGLGLAGCGFALRQPPRLSFSSLALTGFAPRSPLAQELRGAVLAQIPVLDSAARAEVVLHALEDKRERSVVASTASAQVRELQLRVRFEFRAQTPGGRELLPRALLLLTRDMSFSETAALAKEQEEAELFREMQSDVVAQVLRRLASIKL
jgi:LPS-assembly lipoprotein